MIFNLVRLLILSSVLLFMVISKVGALPTGGKFEKFAEQYKPIRETVCAGKATKAQLTDMVKCMEQFKAQLKDNMKTKEAEIKQIVQDCLAEGDKDIAFEVDKTHLEFVYLMCSKKFGECLHRQLPKFRPPGPDMEPLGGGPGNSPPGGPLGPPDADQKVEQFIACEKKALNLP